MLDNISSYKDLTLLIATGERVKKELEDNIEDIQAYFRQIEGAKGYKKSTSYNDYDTIMGERDTHFSVGYGRLLDEIHRLESMIVLEDSKLKRYYKMKKEIDNCIASVTSINVKVSLLREKFTQEQVAEMVDKSTRTVQRIDKKNKSVVLDGMV